MAASRRIREPLSSPVRSLVASDPVQNRNPNQHTGADLRCGAFTLDLRMAGGGREELDGSSVYLSGKSRSTARSGVMVRSG